MLNPTEAVADIHPHPRHGTPRIVTRRHLLGGSLAAAGAALAGHMIPAFAQTTLKRTSEQDMGPFYPVTKPADQDADLTVVKGKSGRAMGQVTYVSGKVTDPQGKPVSGATLEIWQANAGGRYVHPGDPSKVALDPNFEGYAVITTDAEGRYQFKTVKPGAYPTGAGDWIRPPHIHMDIRGRSSRLVTQMYFEGEPLNEKDRLLQRAGNRQGLIARIGPASGNMERDAITALWDVVLVSG
jgi:protocatechuate 3,4-dioxygenase beta subunit